MNKNTNCTAVSKLSNTPSEKKPQHQTKKKTKKPPLANVAWQLVWKQKKEEKGGREKKNLLVGGRKRARQEKEERMTVEQGPFWMSSVSLATGPRPSKAPWAHGLFERSPLFSAASFITVTT